MPKDTPSVEEIVQIAKAIGGKGFSEMKKEEVKDSIPVLAITNKQDIANNAADNESAGKPVRLSGGVPELLTPRSRVRLPESICFSLVTAPLGCDTRSGENEEG